MKALIIYESKHHGNTFKLVDAIEEEWGCDLRNIANKNVDIEHINFDEYDLIGIASGVAFGKLYRNIEKFVASDKFPSDKSVFLLYTCGRRNLRSIHYCDHIKEVLKSKNCIVQGDYGCAGYDTFGFLKLIGGISKGHPNQDEIEAAKIAFEVTIKDMNGEYDF